MMPVLYAVLALLLSINILLGLPKAVDLVENRVSAANTEEVPQVAGVEKRILMPRGKNIPAPVFSATAVLSEDMDSKTLLFVKDPNKRVPIASTTKIMTALVASEYFKANDVLTVLDLSQASGSTMGLRVGEQMSFRGILYGLLLNSGNDAAYTIAQNYPGGVPGFVGAMNSKSQYLGLLNTHFDNPAGFDSPYHFSSAYDLGKIAVAAMENYQFARVVSTKETEVSSLDKSVVHSLKNLNKLLDTPGVLGIKTGTTPQAKENLVGLIERDGHKILTVILGSDDRFGETQKLNDWVFNNYDWQ